MQSISRKKLAPTLIPILLVYGFYKKPLIYKVVIRSQFQTEDNVIVTNRQGYGLELDDDKEEGEVRSERSRPMQEQKRGVIGHEEEVVEEMEIDTEEHLQNSYQVQKTNDFLENF